MVAADRDILSAAYQAVAPRDPMSVRAIAASVHWSPYAFHRRFRSATGLGIGALVGRARLYRAAALLITTRAPVVRVAQEVGYRSHEGFTRAFRRQFAATPSDVRKAFHNQPGHVTVRHHHALVAVGNCAGLHRMNTNGDLPTMSVHVDFVELPAIKLLVSRREVGRDEIAKAIGECLGQVASFASAHGVALKEPPLARYPAMTPGSVVIEPGFEVESDPAQPLPDGISLVTIPGGPAAIAVHEGPYESLQETYVQLEKQIRARGCRITDGAREVYVTDPAEHPDPAHWRTQIVQPIDAL